MEIGYRDHALTVNLDAPLVTAVLGQIGHGDKNADRLVLTLNNGGAAADLAGYSADGILINALGMEVPLSAQVSGSAVSVVLGEGCYDVSGAAVGCVRLVNSDASQVRTVMRFAADVTGGGSGGVYDPDAVIGDLETLLSKLTAMEAATEDGLAAAQEAREAGTQAIANANEAGEQAKATAEEAAAKADAAREAIEGDLNSLKESVGDLSEENAELKSDLSNKTHFCKDTLADGTDIRTIVTSGVYMLDSGKTYVNAPFDKNGGVLTVSVFGSIIFHEYNDTYSGNQASCYAYGSTPTWTGWKYSNTEIKELRAIIETIEGKCRLIKSVITDGTDFNTITENGVYMVDGGSTYINAPFESDGGILEVSVFGNLILHEYASVYSGKTATRYTYGSTPTWVNWRKPFSYMEKDSTSVYYAFGDSTTYGLLPNSGGRSEYNYPSRIGKLLNMQVKNKGVSGQGLLRDWDTIHTNFIENLDMSDAKLITLGWAYNDYTARQSYPMGSYTDTSTDTVIGRFFTIMKEFQEKCPSAVVMLITGYGGYEGTSVADQFTGYYTFADGAHNIKEYYDELEKMCNLNGWSCVNQAKGSWVTKYNWSTLIGDSIHPTDEGYIKYGNYLSAKIASIYSNLA